MLHLCTVFLICYVCPFSEPCIWGSYFSVFVKKKMDGELWHWKYKAFSDRKILVIVVSSFCLELFSQKKCIFFLSQTSCFPVDVWNLYNCLLQPNLTWKSIVSYTMATQFSQNLTMLVVQQAETAIGEGNWSIKLLKLSDTFSESPESQHFACHLVPDGF